MPSKLAPRRRNLSAAAEEWKTRQTYNIEILHAPNLERLSWLTHGFSTRCGGASLLNGKPALNLGFTEWDRRESVEENRWKLVQSIDAGDMALIALRQVHSDITHVFSAAPKSAVQGDAAITCSPGLLLAVQSADCIPILLADTRKKVVAAIHAGWRGTLARITEKTIGRMQMEFGTRALDVVAALGPGIGACCFEVGPEVAQAFAGQFPKAREWFEGPFEQLAAGEEPNPLPWLSMMPPGHAPPAPRVQLNLHAANRWQLENSGVLARSISASNLCTACRVDLFFSYRREGPGTGRMMSVIGIRP